MRGLADSFLESLKMEPPEEPISMVRAKQQKATYAELLKKLVPNVIEIPADGACSPLRPAPGTR